MTQFSLLTLIFNIHTKTSRPQSFPSLNADLHQDIKRRILQFNRALDQGTFPLMH